MSYNIGDFMTDQRTIVLEYYEKQIRKHEEFLKSTSNVNTIIDYLNRECLGIPLGIYLRRYILHSGNCSLETVPSDTKTPYHLTYDGKKYKLKNIGGKNYSVKDELDEYYELFNKISRKFNTTSDKKYLFQGQMTKQNVTRFLSEASVTKKTALNISFALHMNADATNKMFTDILADHGFNFRDENEVIAYYCQSDDSRNSYENYLRLKAELEKRKAEDKDTISDEFAIPKDYSNQAEIKINETVHTDEDLFNFILDNRKEFEQLDRTTYANFLEMYNEAMSRSYFNDVKVYKEGGDNTYTEHSIEKVTNHEQLAKVILDFIPRHEKRIVSKKKKKEKIEYDFQSAEKDSRLSNNIVGQLLTRDRLDRLKSRESSITRKDLILLKFFLFSLDLEEAEELSSNSEHSVYSNAARIAFIEELNGLLQKCGFGKLYVPNRFDNLVLLSLYSNHPYEFFGEIIGGSFTETPNLD